MHICSCFALVPFLSELIIPMLGTYLLPQNVQSGRALKDNVMGFGLKYVFDFKSTLAKYLGFLMHLSSIELMILAGTEKSNREEGTPLPTG